jgi:hypothetical protein
MKYIYLYTTETYATKNWYKIGGTSIKPQKRIRQQDKTSNPEPLIMIACWEAPKEVTDQTIHKKLNEYGFFKLRSNREWYELSKNPKRDIEKILNELNLSNTHPIELPELDCFIGINIPSIEDLWWYKNTPPPHIQIS